MHFHLTNYVQEGTDIRDFLKIMGTRVGRVALFGIPLQQTWSYGNTGDFAPTYYLQTDAPLYYYSFTDAYIAMAYRSLPPAEQARFDPMITGFNPADMYAADHIKRVLQTFPGVFSGHRRVHDPQGVRVGEGRGRDGEPARTRRSTGSSTSPARSGLVVLLHNDVDVPFPKPGQDPYPVVQLRELFGGTRRRRSSGRTAGSGASSGRSRTSSAILERALVEPELRNVYFDISWDEVAKYLVATPETTQAAADLINRYPGSLPVRHRRGRADEPGEHT